MQRLLETKHDTKDAANKAKHFPLHYGKVLFITQDHHQWHWVKDDGSLGEVLALSTLDTLLGKLQSTRPARS